MQTEADVVLVSMPFGPLRLPSIGLGLLKSALDRDGVSARTFYFTFDFAERIGERLYSQISYGTNTTDLVGEWIFSDSLFHHHTDENVANYVEDILRDRAQDKNHVWHEERFSDDFIREILSVRQHTEAFLEDCVTTILACRPKIVGFTSIFLQQVASLSLAKRLKARCPELTIVFGGANCEGEMGREVIRQFPFVDAVISGEADLAFPELVRRVLAGQPYAELPSVFARNQNSTTGNAAAVENLDALPYPDYDEYFDQLSATSFHAALEPNLLLETARGCWWGAKHHCTFCGLNGETMAFRAKSAERALDEFTTVTAKYPGYPIYVVDNILNLAYFKDLLPQLAERKLGLDLFFEVKANLKKEQLRQLRAAGVTIIQPGIESLSDEVLQIMRKGVKALQNIQLLKWCKEIGITPEWNILWGFPGESPQEYFRLAKMLPLLAHLQPPNYALSMRLDRFSPNFNQHAELGFKDLKPFPAYSYVYPLPPESVANLAYYFTFEYAEPRDVESYVRPVAEEVARWKQAYETSDLFMLEQSERLLLWDSRPTAKRRLTALTDKEKFLYLACDQVSTARQIADAWSKHSGWPFNQTNQEDIRQTLDEFVEAGLMLRQGDSYLALAVARSS